MSKAPRLSPLARRALLLLGLLAFAAGSVALVQSAWFGRRLARLLEDRLERWTGEQATVGIVRLDLWGRRARLEGLVLSRAGADGGRTILALEAAEARLGWRDGRPRLRRVELWRPMISLHLDEGELRELPGLRELTRAADPDAPPADELPWDELWVHQADVDLQALWGGRPLLGLRLGGLDARPGENDGAMELRATTVRLALGEVVQEATAWQLHAAHITPRRIHLPRLELGFPSLQLQGALDVEPAGEIAGLFTLTTLLEAYDPLLPPQIHLAGQASVDLELSGRTREPRLSGALLVQALQLGLLPRSPEGRRRDFALGDLHAAWAVEGRQLHLDPLVARFGGGHLRIRSDIDLASRGLSLAVAGEELRLREILRAMDASEAPWVDLDADLEVQAAGTLQPLRLVGSWTLVGQDLRAANGPIGRTPPVLTLPRLRARGALDLVDSGIELQLRSLNTARSAGTARVAIGFRSTGPLDVELHLDPLDLAELRPLGELDLGGRARLDGSLGGPFNALGASAELDVQALRIFDLPFADRARSRLLWQDLRRLSFPDIEGQRGQTRLRSAVGLFFGRDTELDLQLLVQQGRLRDVLGIFLDLDGLDAAMEGSLELRGPVTALDGEARVELGETDLFGERFDRGQAQGYLDQGRFTLESAVLQRAAGSEKLLARGSVGAGWATNIDLRSDGLRLEEFDHLLELQGRLRGSLRLDAVVGGTLFEPEPRGELRLHQLRLDRQALPGSALSFRTVDGTLLFGGRLLSEGPAPPFAVLTGALDPAAAPEPGTFLLAGRQGIFDEQPYQVQARWRDFSLDPLLPPAADGQAISLRLGGEAQVEGAFGAHPLPVVLGARFDQTALGWDRHRLVAAAPWTWRQRGEEVEIDGLRIEGGATSVALAGRWSEEGGSRFDGGGQLELDLLRAVVPGLQRAEGLGALQLSAIREGGRLRPELALQVDGATLRGDWFPGTFEALSLRARATPERLQLDQASALLGGGRVRATGQVELQGFRPRRYDLSATAEDARVRYFDFLPWAQGDATLSFTGPAERPLLAGRMRVRDMLFNERIDWESWMLEWSEEALSGAVAEESRDWFSMELLIEAEDSIRVRNNVADLQATGELRVLGSTARPGLVGRIRALPGGRVYLKERSFELLRGEVRFVDPYSYDPELDFALNTEVRTAEQSYRVDAQVSGTWSDWRTTTRSDPPLPQADVNALLVFGMTREEMERSGALGRALVVEGGDVLMSSFGLVERAEEGIFRMRGLGLLLDPLRPERLDLVSGTSERGSGTVSSRLRLLYENDLSDAGWPGALLLVEQNLTGGQDTYIGLEQRLSRRIYLRGFWSSEEEERRLRLQGAFGAEINLRWEFD